MMLNRELELKEEQTLQYNVLTYFDSICRKENIPYYLFAGTLLGAIREKGFIPWDDDIDICMKEEDATKFVSVFPEYNNDAIFLQTFDSDPDYFVPGVIRLCVRGTDKWGKEYRKACFNKGIYFDIFILSRAAEDITDDINCKKIAEKLASIGYLKNSSKPCTSMKRKIAKLIYSILPISFYKNKYLKYRDSRKIGSQNRVVLISDNVLNKLVYSESCFDKQEFVPFEGGLYPCPVGYHEVLSKIYGNDYMIPRITKSGYHKGTVCEEALTENNVFLQGI